MLTTCLKFFLCCGFYDALKQQQKINIEYRQRWQEEHIKQPSSQKKVTIQESANLIISNYGNNPMNREIESFLRENYNSSPDK